MTSTETNDGRQPEAAAEDPRGRILDDLGGLRERLKNVLDEEISCFRKGEKKSSAVPEIKGLELLKEGGYDVDLEKTIDDMFVVVKSMESQLGKTLGLNALLEKDLNDYKKMVAELAEAKKQLEEKIIRLEEEMPSKRDLQIEIEHLEAERNFAQASICELKSQLEKTKEALSEIREKAGSLDDERKDALSEVNFFESQLNRVTQTVVQYESEIIRLKGENMAQAEKISALEKELGETIYEKQRAQKELKETKEAMNEFRSALTKSKLEAKKSFYKGMADGS